MTVLTIIQARVDSTRLPGKALMPIAGKPMFLYVVEAALPPLVVAIPQGDLALSQICDEMGILVASRPTPEDVLGRFVEAVRVATDHYEQEFSHILRLTGDCPMLTRDMVERFLRACVMDQDTICTNRPLDPDGIDMELFPTRALLGAYEKANNPYDREHVTPAIYRILKTQHLRVTNWDPTDKISVDTREDYASVKYIMECRVK